MTTTTNTTGYICKSCGAESPEGIGYAALTGTANPAPATDCSNTHSTPETVTCIVRTCTAQFFYVAARGDRAYLCLDHGDAYMRANGHQNDPMHSVD